MWYGCKLSDAVAMDLGGGCFLFVVEVMLCYNLYLMCSPRGRSVVSSSWGHCGLETGIRAALRIQNGPRAPAGAGSPHADGAAPAAEPPDAAGPAPRPGPHRGLRGSGGAAPSTPRAGRRGRGVLRRGGRCRAPGSEGSREPRLRFGRAAARPRAPPPTSRPGPAAPPPAAGHGERPRPARPPATSVSRPGFFPWFPAWSAPAAAPAAPVRGAGRAGLGSALCAPRSGRAGRAVLPGLCGPWRGASAEPGGSGKVRGPEEGQSARRQLPPSSAEPAGGEGRGRRFGVRGARARLLGGGRPEPGRGERSGGNGPARAEAAGGSGGGGPAPGIASFRRPAPRPGPDRSLPGAAVPLPGCAPRASRPSRIGRALREAARRALPGAAGRPAVLPRRGAPALGPRRGAFPRALAAPCADAVPCPCSPLTERCASTPDVAVGDGSKSLTREVCQALRAPMCRWSWSCLWPSG